MIEFLNTVTFEFIEFDIGHLSHLNGEAASVNVEGYIAETCEIGGAYETPGKGGAANCEDAEGDVESAELWKAAAKEDLKNPDYERKWRSSFLRAGRKRILRKDAQANVAREMNSRVNVLSRSQRKI